MACAAMITAACLLHGSAAPPPIRAQQAKWRRAVGRGEAYLRRTQETDGSWSEYPATTALAVSALLRGGHTEVADPDMARGVRFILRSVQPDGGIYSTANAATALPNYNTSLCAMTLAQTRNPAYRSFIARAQHFLESSQFDEADDVPPSDPRYGGIGYGSHPDRPDLSNLQMALEALKDTGAGPNAPVWHKAIVFLQRAQNRKESNDQPWAQDASNDGGFVYDSRGRSYATGGDPHASYGSMSYAGLKSYIYCGVTRSDPRVQAAWNWIRSHYTVKEHPGMGDTSLYYYYHTMAKTLDVYGTRIVRDAAGRPHDWASELADQLTADQRPDGSWYNDNARFWENQPPLVTSYTLIALSYCLHSH